MMRIGVAALAAAGLLSVAAPALAIEQPQYTVQTKDGDIISGLVLKENARAVTIATSDHPEAPVEVLKSKIQERAKSTTSMMPENLLDAYTPEQISGLIALLLAGPGGTK